MKRLVVLSLALFFSCLCYGGSQANADTIKKPSGETTFFITIEPEYPGGVEAFEKYVARNIHYPDAARLMCINGKVYVSFTIDSDGKVTNVTAINCLGAGCESEAVRVVQRSKLWRPGVINGKHVKMTYVIPVNFQMETRKVYMENLIASGYGFVFKINGKLYSADDAEQIVGKAFNPDKIEIAEPLIDQDVKQKLTKRHKKETYLILIKSS